MILRHCRAERTSTRSHGGPRAAAAGGGRLTQLRVRIWKGELSEWYGPGKKDGSFQASYYDTRRCVFPFALYGYGRVEIHFQYMLRRRPFANEDCAESCLPS
jgi:hypothetical protein